MCLHRWSLRPPGPLDKDPPGGRFFPSPPGLPRSTRALRSASAGLAHADLVALTKPRIISAPAGHHRRPDVHHRPGAPPLALVGWVLLGGYLMAGGANAINMWFDRDIDDQMTRTRLRPDSRRAGSRRRPALAFGIALGVAGLRPLLALRQPAERLAGPRRAPVLRLHLHRLAQALQPAEHRDRRRGRRLPAAGGLGRHDRQLDLAAIYLFAIIFYWTPPHFWALALIKQGEYAKAGVPMMPVVRGERAHQGRDADLHPDPAPAHAHAGALRRARAASTGSAALASARGSSGTASSCSGRTAVTPDGLEDVPATRCSTWRCSSWRWASTAALPREAAGGGSEVIILDQPAAATPASPGR